MKKLQAIILAGVFCVSMAAGEQAPKKQGSSARSSLDLLVARIDGYWKSLAQKKKVQASQYIVAADRDAFFNATIPPFSNPRFKSLELSSDRMEATTTVIVNRMLTPRSPAIEFPVVEQWRFQKGNWYRRFQTHTLPIPEGVKAQNLSPEQAGDVKREIQQALRFENPVLDFGTVRESSPVQIRLKYSLAGNGPMPVKYKLPVGFDIRGMSNNTLSPGQQRELTIEIAAWEFDGAVDVPLTLIAHRQGVEVPFEIRVKGNVYVPVSVSPKIFRLDKDNPGQEILVRNNSKSDIELVRLHSESGRVSMEPMPATILAGQQIKLKAKLTTRSSTMPRDSLSIPLAQPVDDVGVITLTAVFDTEEPKSSTQQFLPADTSKSCKRPAE
jgi:hypothetical protein